MTRVPTPNLPLLPAQERVTAPCPEPPTRPIPAAPGGGLADVHWLDLRRTVQRVACGLLNENLLNSTSRDNVTCPSCRDVMAN